MHSNSFASTGRLYLAQQMVTRFGLAVSDQAMFAGTSFAFTLLLGRWESHDDFGAFSVAFSIFVLLQNVFEGLVSEPFAVFGADRLAAQFDIYIGRLMVGHVLIGGTLAGCALLIGLALDALGQSALAWAFLGMGLATPFLLGRILMRQALYITRRVHWSAVTGAVYLACSVAALIGLRGLDLITPFSAFIALGSGSLVGSAMVTLVFLGPVWRSEDPALSYRRLIADHLAYGKWAIGERLILWLQTSSIFLVLPLIANLHQSAVYRSVGTLAMPAYMMISAVAGMLLPVLARAQAAPVPIPLARMLVPVAVGMASIYCVLLISFGPQSAHLAFAGQYDTDVSVSLFAAAGAGPVFFAASTALELQMRARQLVRHIVAARIAATVILLVSGPLLIAWFGVLGALLALAETWLVTAIVLAFLQCRRG